MVSRAPAAALVIDEGQRVALVGLAASQAAPHRQVQRAKALLLAADGVANSHIVSAVLGFFASAGLCQGRAPERVATLRLHHQQRATTHGADGCGEALRYFAPG